MRQSDSIEQAKEYLRNRLSAEISFQNNLETLIDEYAYKLVDISYTSNVPPSMFTFSYDKSIKEAVDNVVNEMEQLIITITETLAVSGHTDDKERNRKIMDYIGRDIAGNNFYGRMDGYMDTFKKVTEGVIVAGLLIGT